MLRFFCLLFAMGLLRCFEGGLACCHAIRVYWAIAKIVFKWLSRLYRSLDISGGYFIKQVYQVSQVYFS